MKLHLASNEGQQLFTGYGADYVAVGAMFPTATKPGIVAYTDSLTLTYVIGGRGKSAPLALQLTSGQ